MAWRKHVFVYAMLMCRSSKSSLKALRTNDWNCVLKHKRGVM